ncbi:hypothetical protein D352_02624 [Enterococcus faecium LA4B-2]|nr:hypothetical protein D352_02624 [Enterococcus faecium LA4B-2]
MTEELAEEHRLSGKRDCDTTFVSVSSLWNNVHWNSSQSSFR